MIRKPAETWGRESPTVTAVRAAAATGKSAVETGVRVARGVWLCLIGGVFLLGALAGLAGGGLPTVIGCGTVGGLLVYAGLRRMRPQPAGAPERQAAPMPGPSSGGVDYSRGRLLAHAGLSAVMLAVTIGAAGHFGGGARVVVGLLILLFGFMGFCSLRKSFGDLTAVRWDAHGLTVAGLLKRRTVAWSSVRAIGIETLSTYAYGVIKLGSHQSLCVRLADGPLFGRKLAVSKGLLDLGGRSLESLVLSLQAAQLRQGGAPAAASRPAYDDPFESAPAPRQPSAAATGFAAPPRSPVPTFASPGLAPARAAFGRRGT